MDAIADAWKFLVYVLLPYVTIVVFVGGLIYRVRRWGKLPRAEAAIFPTASSSLGTASRVVGDILLFRKTFIGSKALWVMAVLLHVGLALVVVGHVRTVTEVPWLWSLFGVGEAGIEDITFALGVAAGLAMFAGALLLLGRRLAPRWRVLSLFQDYFVLALLLSIIVTGGYMRLFLPLNLEEIREYATGVLTFHPAVTVSNPLFLWHFLLAQILIMYLPFSKLIHLVSKPITDSWTARPKPITDSWTAR